MKKQKRCSKARGESTTRLTMTDDEAFRRPASGSELDESSLLPAHTVNAGHHRSLVEVRDSDYGQAGGDRLAESHNYAPLLKKKREDGDTGANKGQQGTIKHHNAQKRSNFFQE